jgi:hypothetical protein
MAPNYNILAPRQINDYGHYFNLRGRNVEFPDGGRAILHGFRAKNGILGVGKSLIASLTPATGTVVLSPPIGTFLKTAQQVGSNMGRRSCGASQASVRKSHRPHLATGPT